MDLDKEPIVLRALKIMHGNKVGFSKIFEVIPGAAAVVYENNEVHILYDRSIWECTHPLFMTMSLYGPRLQDLNLGSFIYESKEGSSEIFLQEYCKKYLKTLAQAIKERREAAQDEGNFE